MGNTGSRIGFVFANRYAGSTPLVEQRQRYVTAVSRTQPFTETTPTSAPAARSSSQETITPRAPMTRNSSQETITPPLPPPSSAARSSDQRPSSPPRLPPHERLAAELALAVERAPLDLANTTITVPDAVTLKGRLQGRIRDAYSREKMLPDLLAYAGKTVRLGRLLQALGSAPGEAFGGLPTAALRALDMNGAFNVSLGLASCFVDDPSHLVAIDRLLRPASQHVAPKEAEALIERAQDADPAVREDAYKQLEKLAPSVPASIPVLIKGQADEGVLMAILICDDALRAYGLQALPDLIRSLEDEDRLVPGRAMLVLEGLGRAAAPATEVLVAALQKETDPWLQDRYLNALASIGGDSVARVPGGLDCVWRYLLEVCDAEDGQHERAKTCLNILSTAGEASVGFTPGLLDLLTKSDPSSEESKPYALEFGSSMSFGVCHALAQIWSNHVPASSSEALYLTSPNPERADFAIKVSRRSWSDELSIDLIIPGHVWGMS